MEKMKLTDLLNKILAICADEFEVSVQDVLSESRKQELVYCRKSFSLVVKENLDLKNEIPAAIINRPETVISYFVRKQPSNKYYQLILARIKMRVKDEL